MSLHSQQFFPAPSGVLALSYFLAVAEIHHSQQFLGLSIFQLYLGFPALSGVLGHSFPQQSLLSVMYFLAVRVPPLLADPGPQHISAAPQTQSTLTHFPSEGLPLRPLS